MPVIGFMQRAAVLLEVPAEHAPLEKLKEEKLKELALLEMAFFLFPKLPNIPANADLVTQRQQLAFALFLKHRNGIRDDETNFVFLAEDEQLKAAYFLAEALLLTPGEPPATFFLRFLARFTSSRLAVVRCFRLHPLFFLALTTSTGTLFSALQLSYFVELAFCISILMEKSLRPQTSENEWWFQRIEGYRLKQAFLDREFLGVFTNAVIWGVVNGVCYFDPGITDAGKALWNLGGFFLDIIHDWGFARWELNEYIGLKKSIDDGSFQIKDIDLTNATFQANLDKKIRILEFKETRLTIAAILIFLGMILVFAPALVPAMASFFHFHPLIVSGLMKITPAAQTLRKVGANVVIFAGVCIAGLGGRLFCGDLTWEKLRDFAYDIKAGRLSDWFNKKTFAAFSYNFMLNALVPMGSIGALVFIAFFCPPSAAIIAACTFMAAWFVLMKMNHPFLQSVVAPATLPAPPMPIDKSLDGLIDSEDRLNVNELSNWSRERSIEFYELRRAAGVSQNHFIEVVKDWSKYEDARPPGSTITITRILDSYKSSRASTTSPDTSHEELQFKDTRDDDSSSSISDALLPSPRKTKKSEGSPLNVILPPDIQTKGIWANFFFRCCFGDSAKLSRSTSTYNPKSMRRAVDTRG